MSLTDTRTGLLAALEAAGIRAYYGWGAFTTPCARIFPGEPWVHPTGQLNGSRLQSWEVWAVAGKTDLGATYDELEALVVSVNKAIDGLPNWSHVEWHRPASVDMGGGNRFLAARGIIETRMEV
jgi:hypothetical protein